MNYRFNDLTKEQLKNALKDMGEKPYRGNQIFENIHKNHWMKFDEMTNLSKNLREKLTEYGEIQKDRIYRVFSSKEDGTKKFLIELKDLNIVEAVYMEYENRNTICISSQVGCRMGCSFCASTKAGFIRNLKAYEMLNQIYLVSESVGKRISNLVIMGIGEPLDNYDEILKFIEILGDKDGYNMSIRRMTLSTCGIVPKIYDLAERGIPINLTISLHNPFDEERREIMPITKRYSVEDIIKACEYFYQKTGRRVSYEYTLIHEINDKEKHIDELVRLFHHQNIHINLIPLNPIAEFGGKSSNTKEIEDFSKKLKARGIHTTIRKSQGRDIESACGQLRRDNKEVMS
ncbi:MAG: 23S rRNA (adenine(2503)-C(2))-methyltransferase RlmN [Tissierellia bacterium]|nr:23S rRNA (adenine(2503)-C(2))-methyltransferase RlmN [Tissierellia bacterium]